MRSAEEEPCKAENVTENATTAMAKRGCTNLHKVNPTRGVHEPDAGCPERDARTRCVVAGEFR